MFLAWLFYAIMLCVTVYSVTKFFRSSALKFMT